MPNKDGKGPEGKGPMTGRQMGNCDGAKTSCPRVRPCGRGMDRGFRRATADTQEKTE